jgi:exosortase/archaeosortase family protein
MAKSPPSAGQDGKMPILKFAIKFSAVMLVFYALAETPYCQRVFWPANLQANAWVANGVLLGLQQHTSVAGATIKGDQFEFVIKRGCDATEPVCLLVAAVIAFRAPLRRKLVGILAGTLLLLAINQLRVVALFFVGRDLPGFYHTLHLTVFPAVFVVLALLIWAGWVQWTVGRNRLQTDVKT